LRRSDSSLMSKLVLFISTLLLLGIACRPSVPEEEVVARVGNEVLSQQMMARRMQWKGMGLDQKNEFIKTWVNRELLFQEAKRNGFGQSEELKLEKELLEKEYAVQKLLERTFLEKIQVTDQEIQVYYEQNQDLFIVDEDEVRALHILADTKEQADLARREIQTGKPFEEVVQMYSVGAFKEQSGDMGFIRSEAVIPEIGRIAFHLQENELSQVIQSSYGYHIIKIITKRRKGSVKDLADVYEIILQHLRVKKERAVYFYLL
jgi:parvulin-like peptidyl-prolyl isomerase